MKEISYCSLRILNCLFDRSVKPEDDNERIECRVGNRYSQLVNAIFAAAWIVSGTHNL